MSVWSWLSKPVRWLRTGYPQRAPHHGYVPLLALVPSRSEVENLPEAGEDPEPLIPRHRAGATRR